jgi:protein-S-isoprenylcysteine O-methyltransferase Ste14
MAPTDATDAGDRGPGVIVFPPVLFFVVLGAGLLLSLLWPLRITDSRALRFGLGGALVVAGAAAGRWGERTMHRAGTEVRPDRPTTALVTGGPFRYSRNPLYVSVLVGLAGIALLANAGWVLVLLVPAALVLHFGVVRREERYLEAKFGDAYRDYRARVRRWL